jgi:hypothetical protein
MVYLDTGALLALYVAEAATARVRARVLRLVAGEGAISAWTTLEFASAIAGRVRAGDVTDRDGREAVQALRHLADASFVQLTPIQSDFEAAQMLVEQFRSGLRAGDGLHLAIAHRVSARVFTLDRVMEKAARALGLDTDDSVRGGE